MKTPDSKHRSPVPPKKRAGRQIPKLPPAGKLDRAQALRDLIAIGPVDLPPRK